MNGASQSDLVLVGYVGKPHGVRGDVKIAPETDDPTRLQELKRVVLQVGGSRKHFDVEHVWIQSTSRGQLPVFKLKGVDDRGAADALRGSALFALEEDLALEEGEFFLHELVGLSVEDDRGVRIGTVSDVLSMPAGPVLLIDRPGEPEVMIPAIDEFIVDILDDRIIVRVIEGLLDV